MAIHTTPCRSPRNQLNAATLPAPGNPFRKNEGFFFSGAHLPQHLHNFRYDITGFLENDRIAHPHIKPLYLILVVKRRARNNRTRNGNRVKMGDGRDDARAPNLKSNIFDYSRHLLRSKLERNCEAGRLAGIAKSFLKATFVHFNNNAVNEIRFLLFRSLPMPPVFESSLYTGHLFEISIDFKPELLQKLEFLILSFRHAQVRFGNIIYEFIEIAPCRNGGIELADGPGGDITRIGKKRLSLFFAFTVYFF